MTRKLATILIFLGSLSAAGWTQTAAVAANAAAATTLPKIGLVNIQAALAYTNEGRRDLGELEKKFEPAQKELKSAQEELEALKKQLDASKGKLSDEEQARRTQVIESKQRSLQRKYEDYQNDATAQQNLVLERVLRQMAPVVEEYAKKNGYTMILDVSGQNTPVIWAAEGTNITQVLIDAYNAKSGVPALPAPANTAK